MISYGWRFAWWLLLPRWMNRRYCILLELPRIIKLMWREWLRLRCNFWCGLSSMLILITLRSLSWSIWECGMNMSRKGGMGKMVWCFYRKIITAICFFRKCSTYANSTWRSINNSWKQLCKWSSDMFWFPTFLT